MAQTLSHRWSRFESGRSIWCRYVSPFHRPQRPLGRVELYSTPFLTSALEGGEESAARLGCALPPGKTRYPLYRRLGGPQGRSGQVRKISPPPGFDSRTVQPVGSRYTDYATRPTHLMFLVENFALLRVFSPSPSVVPCQ
jgi:hypothetical protein